jgi:ABC-type nitrate/sulfonate/bicarbonate transport system ATPase subunit
MAEGSNQMVGEIVFDNVKKSFRQESGEVVHALNQVDMTIHPGDFVCLIGPSGCGKTTLLRLLAGLDNPTEGAIYLDGHEVLKPSYDRGLVFQDHTLFPWLNIYDNVSFGLRARKIYKEKKDTVSEFINLVGISGFEKSYPHQLSGGMCQRAALARALIGHPKVLLLDEPFGALDAFTRMNMQDELLRIKAEQNMTMVMVTHDVDEAVYLSNRIVVMSPRPAKIEKIVDVDLSHPRDRNNSEFIRIRSEILKILHFAGKEEDIDYMI